MDGLLASRILDSTSAIVVVLDREGNVVRFNRGAEEATGYTEAELLGRSWFMLLAPPDRYPEVRNTFDSILRTGSPNRFQNPILTKSGEERVFSWTNDRVVVDGRVVGILSFGQDVTEQVRLRRLTDQRNEILARIFDSTHVCLVYLDPQFNFIRVNRAYAEVCAHPPEFFPGKNHFDLYPHAENKAIFQRVVETGESFTIFEKPFEFPDHPDWGVTYWDWTLQPLKDAAGRVEGLLFILLDVTARKRMEGRIREMERMDALGRLAGGIAHDFNNLLTAVLGFAELGALKAEGQPAILEYFSGIVDLGIRASHLTRQLLAFSRRQASEPRALDLNALIIGMHKLLSRFIGGGIETVFLPDPSLWTVKADPGQMEQVLMNLAVNAKDAMPEGGTLTIEASNKTLDTGEAEALGLPSGDYVAWSVSDSGKGMDEATAARIFEPFFTTKVPGQGTGLGLWTTATILRQHGGAIRVESAPGRGTRFTLLLPRTREDASSGPRPVADLPTGQETLLVVEDHPLVRQMITTQLSDLGYRVLEAMHGDEAILRAREHPGDIHLAVVDLLLPMRGGDDTARCLREARPDLKVLFISGYAEELPRSLESKEPWSRFLEKPFSRAQLALAVRGLLDGAPA